jgi:hypothetical protein
VQTTGQRTIDLGRTQAEFMDRLDLSRSGGKHGAAWPRESVGSAMNIEPVQMRVRPAEGDLNPPVQLAEGIPASDQEAPPDHRADPKEANLELIDWP